MAVVINNDDDDDGEDSDSDSSGSRGFRTVDEIAADQEAGTIDTDSETSSSSSSSDSDNDVIQLTDVQGEDGFRKTKDQLQEDLQSGNTENLSPAETSSQSAVEGSIENINQQTGSDVEREAISKQKRKQQTALEDVATTTEQEKQADVNLSGFEDQTGNQLTEEELRGQIQQGNVNNLKPGPGRRTSRSAKIQSRRNRLKQENVVRPSTGEDDLVDVGDGMEVPRSDVEVKDPIFIEETPPLNQVLEESPVQYTNPVSGETFTPRGENIQRGLAGFETITSTDSLEFLATGLTGGDTDEVVAESIERQAGEDEDILGETGEFIQSGPGLVLGGKGLTAGVQKAGAAIGSVSPAAGSAFTTGAAGVGAGIIGFEVGRGTGDIAQGDTQEGLEKFIGAGLATAGAAGRTPAALKSTPDIKLPTQGFKAKAKGVKDFAKADFQPRVQDQFVRTERLDPTTTRTKGLKAKEADIKNIKKDRLNRLIQESGTIKQSTKIGDRRTAQEFKFATDRFKVEGQRLVETPTRRTVAKEKVFDSLTNTRKGQARLARQKQKQKQRQKEKQKQEDDEVIDISERIKRKQTIREELAKIESLKPVQTDVAAAGFAETPGTVNDFAGTKKDTSFVGAFPQQGQAEDLSLEQDLGQDLGQDQGLDQGIDDILDQPQEEDLIQEQPPVEDQISIQENDPFITQRQPPQLIESTKRQPPSSPKAGLELPDFGDKKNNDEEEDFFFDAEQDTEFRTSVAGILGFGDGAVSEKDVGENSLTGLEIRVNSDEDPMQGL